MAQLEPTACCPPETAAATASESVPIACRLSAAERPRRAALMARLGSESLLEVQTRGLRAVLRFRDDGALPGLREFVSAESDCCPFFAFSIDRAAGRPTLDVSAPEGGEWAIRGLVAGFVRGWDGLA